MAKLKNLSSALPTDDLLEELDQIQILGGVSESTTGDNYGCNLVDGCVTNDGCTVYNHESCGNTTKPCGGDTKPCGGGTNPCGGGLPCGCEPPGGDDKPGNGPTGVIDQFGWM